MPRETIRRLSDTVETLLVAGAHLADGSAELARDEQALRALVTKLGAKSPPVFAQLAEQVAKARTAPAKTGPKELLALAAQVGQVRAGLVQLSEWKGETEPLPRVPTVETPCNTRELYALQEALVGRGQGRLEVIETAIERGDVGDLRLVHAAVQAMGDPYLGDVVADRVAPRFGRALIGPLRRKVRFPGTTVDGRRLRALVAVEGAEARDLVDRGLAEGSPEVRAAVLDALADHLPGVAELEPLVLGAVAGDRSSEVRRAAVRALAGYRSDAAKAALAQALTAPTTLQAAAEALGRSPHPGAGDVLLGEMTRITEAQTQSKKAERKGKTKGASVAASLVIPILLEALAARSDARTPDVARPLLREHPLAAGRALSLAGTDDDRRAVADLLLGKEAGLYETAAAAAARLPPGEAAERFARAVMLRDKRSPERLRALAATPGAPRGATPYLAAALAAFAERPRPDGIVEVLASIGDPSAVEPMMAAFATEKKAAAAMASALGVLGDRRAISVLIPRLVGNDWMLGWSVREAILKLSDERTVPHVRDLYLEREATGDAWHVASLLRALERKYPGC